MPNYVRPSMSGASIFVTAALQVRGTSTLTENIEHLRDAFAQTCAERAFTTDAIVILPDHFHMVMTLPDGDADYATRIRIIKARFSRQVATGPRRRSQIVRSERGVWQRRYWEHHIRNAKDYRAHIEYCWKNPVKHGFVETPKDWPYSSIHRDIKLNRVPNGWI